MTSFGSASRFTRAAGLVLFLLPATSFAQAPAPPKLAPPKPEQQEDRSDRLQFSVAVESVTLDVFVTDREGRFVSDLEEQDFQVYEDGVEQPIAYFTAEFTPVTTLLLLDSSSSVRSSLSAIQTAAYLFVRNLSQGDRSRIGLFQHDVRFGPSFTDDMTEHLGVIRSMRPSGKTALYDAILAALEELAPVEGRKVLLIFTDGDDAGPDAKGSVTSVEEVLEGGKLSEATIYTVGFTGWGPQGSDSVNRAFLTRIAEESGGRPFFPEDVEEVKGSFEEVRESLHRQYRIAYVPQTVTPLGQTWRQIVVRVKGRDDVLVRTRQGYYATGDQAPLSPPPP